MRRRNESQAVVNRFVIQSSSILYADVVGNRGITGSRKGKSSSQRLPLNLILKFSAHSKKELKSAEQIKALGTV